MRHLLFFLFLLIFYAHAAAQEGKVLGIINDPDGKAVEFANIAVKGTNTGTSTAKDGSFELKIPANKEVVVMFSCMGFATDSIRLTLKNGENRALNLILKPSATELSTIEVKDQQLRTNTFNRLDPKAITYIPTFNATVEDLIKTMPGVSSRNELTSQYSVRGGSYDENLTFMNDIEIYRPYLVRSGQQEGQSFLNPDLVSGISFSAGGFDAKYGDKMSSVLDIKYKKPTQFAGSFDINFLGASAHVEGTIRRFAYLLGVRYKTNTYLLNSLDTKGNYKPRFFDVQGMLYYDFSRIWELSVFGSFTDNIFKLIPQSQTTTFGSDLVTAYRVNIFFDGNEDDSYQNWLTAATLAFRPSDKLRLKFIASAYQTHEAQTYDISGEYWLGQISLTGNNIGSLIQLLGVGAYIDHARDYLDGTVFNIEHRGNWDKGISQMTWGVKYEHDIFTYRMNEWQLIDSAGYSLPHPVDSLGVSNPPHDDFYLKNAIQSSSKLSSNKGDVFLQDTWTFKNEKNDIGLTAGIRAIYSDYNSQFLLNPRVNLSFKPHWHKEVVFRLSGGVYSQPPTFREITNLEGQIVPGLKAQTSYQAVFGSDLYFRAWKRPFKFVTEVYYKYIQDLIPYEIDNLRIRYYGTNDAHGYATGIDFRINGEFVKGAESWASLSLMKTEEYFQGSWIPRPSDQRFTLAIYFQDYIPGFPTWKVAITMVYGSGLPYGAPDSPKQYQTLRMPPYRRVDLGLSKELIGEQTHFSPKNPLRVFHSVWIGLDIFNLFDFANIVSYQWITDIQGRQYNVPNYLTPRLFNLKLVANF